MARIHYWQYIVNNEGQPIPDVEISVGVQTGGDAFVYRTEAGGSPISTAPQVTSDGNGFIEFWIGNVNETAGYATGNKFKLDWTDSDGDAVSIENIDILPNAPQFVGDTTSSWTSAGGGEYLYDMNHGLGNDYPIVICWNRTTGLIQEPLRITTISSTMIRIFESNNSTIFLLSVAG
jgi:hypothetical protein